MKVRELVIAITKAEGKKQSLSIAQVKEVVRILACLLAKDQDALIEFLNYGKKTNENN